MRFCFLLLFLFIISTSCKPKGELTNSHNIQHNQDLDSLTFIKMYGGMDLNTYEQVENLLFLNCDFSKIPNNIIYCNNLKEIIIQACYNLDISDFIQKIKPLKKIEYIYFVDVEGVNAKDLFLKNVSVKNIIFIDSLKLFNDLNCQLKEINNLKSIY